ncbi:MAG: hypothetical protein ACK5EY_06405, partial [Cyclobacteriaceae bacterium]
MKNKKWTPFFYFPKKEGQQFAHCLPFLFQYKACLFAEGVQSQPRSKNGLQFTVCFICRQVFLGALPSSASFQYLFFKDIFGRSITQ